MKGYITTHVEPWY